MFVSQTKIHFLFVWWVSLSHGLDGLKLHLTMLQEDCVQMDGSTITIMYCVENWDTVE